MAVNLPSDFYQWINDNNPSEHLEYRKGWWDYVETVQRLMHKYDVEKAQVVGTYLMTTPPPKEELLMPVVKLEVRGTTFILRYDFGRWPEVWTISAKRQSKYAGPTFGLFDEELDVRTKDLAGLERQWVYPPYCDSPAQFSCELGDEWDVATFVTILSYDA